MDKKLKSVLVVGEDIMGKKYTEVQQLRELHTAYNKHEIVKSKTSDGYRNDALAYCRTCGLVMMYKYDYDSDLNDKIVYKPLNLSQLRRQGMWSEWDLGKITAYVVSRIPQALRHTIYEQVLFRIADDDCNDEEAALILSLRDKSAGTEKLREYAINTGGKMAYAYAKVFKDFAADLEKAVCTDSLMTYKFLEISKHTPSDEVRAAISRDPELALKFAMNIDKKPHPVTRNGAARNPSCAAGYAIEVDKSPDTTTLRGIPLMKIALRTDQGATMWKTAFGLKRDNMARTARSKTMYGAFSYARDVDRCAHPVTQAGVKTSRFYAPRYAYEILGEPFKEAEQATGGSGWDALQYALTFRLNTQYLKDAAHFNWRAGWLYDEYLAVLRNKKMTKQDAMKKSYYALAFAAVHNKWHDKELKKRASKNRTYHWIWEACSQNIKKIAAAKARNEKAKAAAV